MVDVRECGAAFGALVEGAHHELDGDRSDWRDELTRDRGRDETRAGAQAGERGHRRRAEGSVAAADDEHVAELALVGVDGARLFGERLG